MKLFSYCRPCTYLHHSFPLNLLLPVLAARSRGNWIMHMTKYPLVSPSDVSLWVKNGEDQERGSRSGIHEVFYLGRLLPFYIRYD